MAAASILAAAQAFAECAPNHVDLRGGFGQARFTVELADTDATRAQGLMHRASMPQSHGMLFVYPAPHSAFFWMRNTLIPLDMIFVGEDGEVLRIHQNAIPLDESLIKGGPNVLLVLELNGGVSERLGLQEGDVLRHPSLGNDALWPCDGG
ncbi:hypothetical protein ACMU_17665 [Actibacterium mucosum KCTC 23349]|uniref:DUF192 domain-containing protein n=1 Tax=Actibacterium mucosum KCTC 23349 TaxID=1454373 RepID=A0A037ZG80_9RHOB|nr:hypothetical protein ACMU_17665 [Actibacterium mucosum KCTC 23349]